MQEAGHLSGGASIYMRYPIRVTIADPGIPILSITDNVGVSPPTATQAQDVVGLGMDISTYSTSQADLRGGEAANAGLGARSFSGLDMGRMVTVSVRPDLIVRMRASGAATENTALQVLVNSSASAGGTTVTAAALPDVDFDAGTFWCTKGANIGYARTAVSGNDTTTLVTTVPFPRAIAVDDEFFVVPWSGYGTGASAIDGSQGIRLSTLFTQADASVAVGGTVAEFQVFKLDLEGASNTNVLAMFLNHQWNRQVVAS